MGVPAFYVAFELQADLAQLVAHRTCNAGVRGSSPLVGPTIWPLARWLGQSA
jgi:hypothetical protein